MEFTNAFIEKMVNQTFPGLTLYYRDADLEQPVAGMYQPGQILRNGFFLDVTNMGGGIGQNTRFLVASTKAIPLSAINPEVKKWGLHVINVNAFFKVLDVIREGGKMQVLLLQIPEEGVELFRSAQINLEQQVITKGRSGSIPVGTNRRLPNCRPPNGLTVPAIRWGSTPEGNSSDWSSIPPSARTRWRKCWQEALKSW